MENKITKIFVDVGSLRLKGLIGELASRLDTKTNKDRQTLKILKYAEVYSEGVEEGKIVDIESFSSSLRELVAKLNENMEEKISTVILGISGNNFGSKTTNIEINLVKENQEETKIEEVHMNELVQRAKERLLVNTQDIIESVIYNIKLDNDRVVKDPIGSEVSNLKARIHLIYGEKEYIQKIKEAVELADLKLEKIILGSIGAARALLDDTDLDRGTALVDIGDETTDINIYKQEKLIFTKTLPMGGRNFMKDLTWIDDIKEATNKNALAYEILNKYRRNHTVGEYIYYGNSQKVRYDFVQKIISARTKDLANNIKGVIEKSGFSKQILKGIILTGGLTQDPAVNIDELIDEIQLETKDFTRVVIPKNYFSGIKEIKSSMTVVLGMMYIVMQEESKKLKENTYEDPEIQNKDYVFSGEQKEENIEKEEDVVVTEENNEEEKETKEKVGVFGAIKEWWSNFI